MAFDDVVAKRVRRLRLREPDAGERKMFAGGVRTERALRGWVDVGVAAARTLAAPPRPVRPRRRPA